MSMIGSRKIIFVQIQCFSYEWKLNKRNVSLVLYSIITWFVNSIEMSLIKTEFCCQRPSPTPLQLKKYWPGVLAQKKNTPLITSRCSYPRVEHLKCASFWHLKQYNRLENLDWDKHSSLLQKLKNYSRQSFITLASDKIKPFYCSMFYY